MVKKPGKCDVQRKREKQHRLTKIKRSELENERAAFDYQANRPYHYINTTTLRWTYPHIPKGHILSLMLMFKKPLPRQLVEEKLEQAFGDSK